MWLFQTTSLLLLPLFYKTQDFQFQKKEDTVLIKYNPNLIRFSVAYFFIFSQSDTEFSKFLQLDG
jgi:hypothetical protein